MKSKLVYLLVSVLLVVGLVVGVLGCAKPAPAPAPAPTPAPAPAKVFEWRLQTHLTPTHFYGATILPDAIKKIETATKGQLKIELFHEGMLSGTPDIFDGVSKGVFEIATTVPSYYSGLEPAFLLYGGLPYSLKTMPEYTYLFDELGWLDIYKELTAKHGVYGMLLYVPASWGELSSKVPIRTAEDFKGVKIRGFGMPLKLFEKMGALPVSIPGGEIYTALATGVVDAAGWGSPAVNYILKLHEVTKYWITPPLMTYLGLCTLVNMDAWNSLPDDMKVIVETTFYQAGIRYPTFTQYEDSIALKDMIENWEIEVITLTPEAQAKMQEKALELWDEASQKDEYSARLIKILKDYMKVKGYID